MSDLLFDRERAALVDLRRLIEERRRGEDELTASATRVEKLAVEKRDQARQELAANQERELADLDAAFAKEQEELAQRHAAEEAAAQQDFADHRQRLEETEQAQRGRIDGELRDALWMAESVSEGGQKRVQQHLEMVQRQVAAAEQRITALWQEVEPLLARFDLERDDVIPKGKLAKPTTEAPDPEGPLNKADLLLQQMRRQWLLPWARWPATVAITVGAFALAAGPAALVPLPLLGRVAWVLSAVMAAFLAGLVSRLLLYSLARRRLRAQGRKFIVQLAQARDLGILLTARTEPWAAAERAALRTRYDEDRRKAEAAHRPQLEELAPRLRAERDGLEQQFQIDAQTRRERHRQGLEASRRRHEVRRSDCLSRQQKERRDTNAVHAEELRSLLQTRIQKARHLRQHWETESARLMAVFNELQGAAACGLANSIAQPQAAFGTLTVNVRQLTGDITDEKLAPLPSQPLQLPAYLPFPRLGGLMLHAFGSGRAAAVQALQALMLRFLISLPPGKVRFTIFDPVGLGDNFAAFMHLADHDEALVSGRIWTEPAHIEKQLAELTAHMENVIQRYLRSQFSSIEDYNAQAGEVAEPYRILVAANFPTNFTPQAARRLVSIVQSGSSCGVYALISLDTRQPLPQGFQLDDLEQLCLNLYWRDERFHWGDAELDRYPLTLEAPPDAEQVIDTVRRVGALSRDANRVRVPFSFIAPAEEEIWKADSRRGVNVPLGRAGAVNRQTLQLGKGTSQHVLVAGKTGSGKSTLWHALITNAALLYSPDELELYLIDFKKGVEFKQYAAHQLPHAKVIAIESEREFGFSVLQRLDAELRQRGDLFRAAGVNDIASYRDQGSGVRGQESGVRGQESGVRSQGSGGASLTPDSCLLTPGRCPRILLIVDEFQEFFIEDDRLSQEAALLLDRLVRQGRAFGLHVLLGSQTLGGAYSLARSTIDQMAVRVALQCSEADAQLILNKDNSAARLLSRPGEAIYNDANGAVEGNEIFQVVWLPEEEREDILRSIRRRTERERPDLADRPPLVFEGNTPAELDRNPLLRRLLEGGAQEETAVGRAWLGEAIAIKDPTAAVFRPQTGDNLLIVGQNDEAALALLAAALISLAVQQPSARFLVLDGTPAHQAHAGYLQSVIDAWPQSMILVERTGLAAALAGLAEEMNRRLQGGGDRGPRYLLVNGLQFYREFRRGDDDLGFGRRGAERAVSPAEHLQALLRDGPAVGVHVLIWCDALVNVMRSLDRAGLRECGQRVLFQMNAADSSHLLDAPLASRLGRNRALYHTDELGQPEKFRPYGVPSLVWLAEVTRALAARPKAETVSNPR